MAIVVFHVSMFLLGRQSDYSNLLSFLFVGDPKIILPTSWFVFAIMSVYIGFYISWKVNHDTRRIIATFAVLELIFVLTVRLLLGWGEWWSISAISLPLGMYAAYSETDLRVWIHQHFISLTLSLSLLFALSCILSRFEPGFAYLQNSIVPILIYVFICTEGLRFRILDFIGNISFEFYLVQGAVAYYAVRYIQGSLMICLFTILVSTLCAYLLSQVSKLIKK